jgi:mannose-6-phosphate isomerase-like protein (cupin superfamily)
LSPPPGTPRLPRRSFGIFPFGSARASRQSAGSSSHCESLGGRNRLCEHHTIGVSTTAYKVLTTDSSGALFLFEHRNAAGKKASPPRHLHHHEDEWFYVIEGQYIAEVGSTRVELKPGDSILDPREVPHAWAFVGDTPGRVLIAFTPANKMEAFFRDNEKRRKGNEYMNDAEVYRAYGMELLGAPLPMN